MGYPNEPHGAIVHVALPVGPSVLAGNIGPGAGRQECKVNVLLRGRAEASEPAGTCQGRFSRDFHGFFSWRSSYGAEYG